MATGRFNNIVLGTNLAGVNNGDGSITLSATGGAPSGAAGGDLTGTYPNPTLAAAGGGAAGPVGDTTHTPVVTVDAKGRVTALTSAVIAPTGGSPTGAAGGDLTGTYPNPTLATAGGGAAGPTGDATHAPIVTVDAKGRVTALSSTLIAGTAPGGSAGGDLTGTYPNPTLGTAGPGATGPLGSSTVAPVITIDAKGRVTALSSATITPAAGSGGALTVIADSTLGADAANFDFTSIAGTYAQLMLKLYLRGDTAATSIGIRCLFNNDSGSNYDRQYHYGTGASSAAGQEFAMASAYLGDAPANTALASLFGYTGTDIPNYANTAGNKVAHSTGDYKTNTTSGSMLVINVASFWRSTAAITRLTIFPAAGNWRAGSRATLYGMS